MYKSVKSIQIVSVAAFLFFTSGTSNAEVFSGTGVSQVWGDYSNIIGASKRPYWATLSNNPDSWVLFPNMSGAAINVLKAAGKSNPDLSISVVANPFGSDYKLNNLSISGGSNADNYVRSLLFLTASSPENFAYATIGSSGGLLTTTTQASIATISLARKMPVNYTLGSIYFYNATTNQIEKLDNVVTEISMPN